MSNTTLAFRAMQYARELHAYQQRKYTNQLFGYLTSRKRKDTLVHTAMRTGRPPKFEAGTVSVLYVRVPNDMLEALDRIVEKRQQERTEIFVSRADVVRDLLSDAMRRVGGRE